MGKSSKTPVRTEKCDNKNSNNDIQAPEGPDMMEMSATSSMSQNWIKKKVRITIWGSRD